MSSQAGLTLSLGLPNPPTGCLRSIPMVIGAVDLPDPASHPWLGRNPSGSVRFLLSLFLVAVIAEQTNL